MANCPDPCVVELVSDGGGGEDSFSPPSISINLGQTVTWTYADPSVGRPHTVTSGACPGGTCVPDGEFDSGFADLLDTTGEMFMHTFTVAGTFPYHCGVHLEDMQGTVTVLPAP